MSKPSRAVKSAEDPLELFRYRWYNYVSIRQDNCEKQMFDPAVSGISDGNEPMPDGRLAKCNAFDGAIVRPPYESSASTPWRGCLGPLPTRSPGSAPS
jgi:hypothetical protein